MVRNFFQTHGFEEGEEPEDVDIVTAYDGVGNIIAEYKTDDSRPTPEQLEVPREFITPDAMKKRRSQHDILKDE